MEKTQRRRTLSPHDYAKMLRRMIRAAGSRVGHGDPEDIAELLALRDDIDKAVQAAIDRQRETGITWQSIGEAMGTTRQAALMRWGKVDQAVPPIRHRAAVPAALWDAGRVARSPQR